MKKILVALAAAMLLGGVVTSAHALSLQYSNDGSTWNTVTDNGAGDLDSYLGNISFSTTSLAGFNNISITGTTLSFANGAALFTNTLEVTGSVATLYLKMSDSPYSISMPLGSGAHFSSGLTLQRGNATAELETYYGSSLFDTTNLISTLGTTVPDFVEADGTLPGITNPFSLTELLTIHHNGSTTSQVTASLELTPVPEPGTLVLLGAGFLGLGLYGRRRMQK